MHCPLNKYRWFRVWRGGCWWKSPDSGVWWRMYEVKWSNYWTLRRYVSDAWDGERGGYDLGWSNDNGIVNLFWTWEQRILWAPIIGKYIRKYQEKHNGKA